MKRAAILFLMVAALTGCESVRRMTGLDRNDATHVDVPVTQRLERPLAADGLVTFSPTQIDGAPSTVRAFVKNADWLTATPGGWYEIPVRFAADASVITEYVVVSVDGQSARVYNQPNFPTRALVIESVPPGAYDPGRPAA